MRIKIIYILGWAAAILGFFGSVRCPAETAYLDVQSSNQIITVTWTNFSEIHLLESTDLITWTASTRPFSYVGGRNRFRLPSGVPPRFYRLTGLTEPAPRIGWESELGLDFLTWPYPTAGFTLQSRDNVMVGAWTTVPDALTVAGGYKRFSLLAGDNILFFRLSRPINHVLITGQSLSVGVGGLPILSVSQPFQNKMFRNQVTDDLGSLVPLVERFEPPQISGETMASGFANSVSAWAGVGEHNLLVSNCGRSGSGYSLLKRGTDAHTQGTNQIAAGRLIGQDLGYQFRAVFVVHGEGDGINQQYDANIREWQSDFASAVRDLTGQLTDTPMFHSQMSSWGGLNANFVLSPFLTLAESELNPAKTLLVSPKYFLPYSDLIHLTADGYRWLGEYYAKAYQQFVVHGLPWSPLRPIDVTRSNEFITVTFTGQVGDLVLDTNAVTDPQRTVYAPLYGPSVAVTVDPVNDTIVFQEAHQLQPGDAVYFHGPSAPGGLELGTPGRRYFVRSAPQSNTVTVAVDTNGPTADFTSTGTNVLMYQPLRVSIGPSGFEYMDDEGGGIPWHAAAVIEAVEIIAPAQVRLRLSKIPTAGHKRLRYGYTSDLFVGGGPTTGPRGCLRDSDPAPSLYGHSLYNWCVHFDKPVE